MKRYYKVVHIHPQPPVDKLSYPQPPVDTVDRFLVLSHRTLALLALFKSHPYLPSFDPSQGLVGPSICRVDPYI